MLPRVFFQFAPLGVGGDDFGDVMHDTHDGLARYILERLQIFIATRYGDRLVLNKLVGGRRALQCLSRKVTCYIYFRFTHCGVVLQNVLLVQSQSVVQNRLILLHCIFNALFGQFCGIAHC